MTAIEVAIINDERDPLFNHDVAIYARTQDGYWALQGGLDYVLPRPGSSFVSLPLIGVPWFCSSKLRAPDFFAELIEGSAHARRTFQNVRVSNGDMYPAEFRSQDLAAGAKAGELDGNKLVYAIRRGWLTPGDAISLASRALIHSEDAILNEIGILSSRDDGPLSELVHTSDEIDLVDIAAARQFWAEAAQAAVGPLGDQAQEIRNGRA